MSESSSIGRVWLWQCANATIEQIKDRLEQYQATYQSNYTIQCDHLSGKFMQKPQHQTAQLQSSQTIGQSGGQSTSAATTEFFKLSFSEHHDTSYLITRHFVAVCTSNVNAMEQALLPSPTWTTRDSTSIEGQSFMYGDYEILIGTVRGRSINQSMRQYACLEVRHHGFCTINQTMWNELHSVAAIIVTGVVGCDTALNQYRPAGHQWPLFYDFSLSSTAFTEKHRALLYSFATRIDKTGSESSAVQ